MFCEIEKCFPIIVQPVSFSVRRYLTESKLIIISLIATSNYVSKLKQKVSKYPKKTLSENIGIRSKTGSQLVSSSSKGKPVILCQNSIIY